MHIVHVASVELSPNSGMGRIAFEWKKAFEKQGVKFTHIGWKELNRSAHPLLFGWIVRKYIFKHQLKPDIILAHEPSAGFLKFKGVRLIVFSHGIEERYWQVKKKYQFESLSWKAKLLPSLFRFYSNNFGFRKADKILLSNYADKDYLIQKKEISAIKISVFKNGYHPYITQVVNPVNKIGCLFNASWIERKGIQILVSSFNLLLAQYPFLHLHIAGTVKEARDVLQYFHISIHSQILVYPKLTPQDEHLVYNQANIFLLPSYFEGQSLALTQAMYMGLCPVVADNCGQIDLVQHRRNGLLFNTGDLDSFKLQIEELLKNPSLITHYGKLAHDTVQDLIWENVANEVVQSVISN